MTNTRIPAPPAYSARPTDTLQNTDFDRMATDPVDLGIRTRRSTILTEAGKNDLAKARVLRENARQEGRYTR